MQRITIKNVGPVKELNMEINRFNFLIGEQATGKSTVAKCIYYFRNVKTVIAGYLNQIAFYNSYQNKQLRSRSFEREFNPVLKDIFTQIFGYSWDLDPDLDMTYYYTKEKWIRLSLNKNRGERRYIEIYLSPTLRSKILEARNEAQEMYLNLKNAVTSADLAEEERRNISVSLQRKVTDIFADDEPTYYIPAGRTLLTELVGGSAYSLNDSIPGKKDLITERFLSLISNSADTASVFRDGITKAKKSASNKNVKFDQKMIGSQITSMMKGEYFRFKGEEYLRIQTEKGERDIAVNYLSSGQQSALWILNFLYLKMLVNEKAFIIIEEPEAHIYPAFQKNITELITEYANITGGHVLVTTHSPYVLLTAGNFYYAGVLAKQGQEDRIAKIIGKNSFIAPGELTALKLYSEAQTNGKYYTNIVEPGEIRASMVDDVSASINETYTALYDIELDMEEMSSNGGKE